jgi:hypothetical protein
VPQRDLREIGLKRGSAQPGSGKFATPPVKRLQGIGVVALLGLLGACAAFVVRRRSRS